MTLRVISLGAGVQSTTMALMAAHGEIGPMPNCAIFADTGWEPRKVYEHLEWLKPLLPFPVHRVAKGNLRADLVAFATGDRTYGARPNPPLHMAGESDGMLMRQCTQDYKIAPINAKVKALLKQRGEEQAETWIGISTDEAMRMKPSRNKYSVHRWPLIEAGMSRNDCLRWMERHGYPVPPKSSCIGCPYHSDYEWRSLPAEEFADAVEFERILQAGRENLGLRGVPYLHRSRVPLDQADLSTAEDRGQLNMFNNECEGMCGV